MERFSESPTLSEEPNLEDLNASEIHDLFIQVARQLHIALRPLMQRNELPQEPTVSFRFQNPAPPSIVFSHNQYCHSLHLDATAAPESTVHHLFINPQNGIIFIYERDAAHAVSLNHLLSELQGENRTEVLRLLQDSLQLLSKGLNRIQT